MSHRPLVFILILNFNGQATLPACLQSIFRLRYPSFRVVIIDNASTDGSFENMKQKYAQAHFIKNSENVGFARGMNVGIRFALNHGAEYLWLINQDTSIAVDSLEILASLMSRHPRVGMVSPLITTPARHHTWFAGGAIDWLRLRGVHTKARSRHIPYETGFISGCAPLIRRDVFQKIGLFDERFFLYYEDVDLSLRAKRAGFQLVIHPRATVTHSEESRKNPKKIYWLVRSGLFFFRKNMPPWAQPYFQIAFFIRRLRNTQLIKHETGKTAESVRDAFRDFRTYGY